MNDQHELSGWVWVAIAFLIGKGLFHYLDWLYRDKDHTLKENVLNLWAHLVEHDYYEVARDALHRLDRRLAVLFAGRASFVWLTACFLEIGGIPIFIPPQLAQIPGPLRAAGRRRRCVTAFRTPHSPRGMENPLIPGTPYLILNFIKHAKLISKRQYLQLCKAQELFPCLPSRQPHKYLL